MENTGNAENGKKEFPRKIRQLSFSWLIPNGINQSSKNKFSGSAATAPPDYFASDLCR
jgi:hypothetical protein